MVTMESALRVLLVAEGSGGHVIPALEVASSLTARGAQATLLYVQRPQLWGLLSSMMAAIARQGVELVPLALDAPAPHRGGPWVMRRARFWWRRLGQAVRVWRMARRQLRRRQPDIVVGFGGWVCVPVTFAARWSRIPMLLHEQNVSLGQANRFLMRWADEVALSFPWRGVAPPARRDHEPPAPAPTRGGPGGRARNGAPRGRPSWVVTGLPIRRAIGTVSRQDAAQQLGCDPSTPTIVVLGGSQGAQAINRLVCQALATLTPEERASWQFIHLTGQADCAWVQQAYAHAGMRTAWVQPYFSDMAYAYALADVVVARAGASTIAELARCGKPALLIPYPYARAHQRENVQLVEAVGGGVWLDEATLTPTRLAELMRTLVKDERLRGIMGAQMHTLETPEATEQLAGAICRLARKGRTTHAT